MTSHLGTFWNSARREVLVLPSTVRGASRSLRRAPGFVAIATLSLGAALGLSTSVFALIDAMRHPVSPFNKVDELYKITLIVAEDRPGGASPSRHDVSEALASLHGVSTRSSARSVYQEIDFPDGSERRGVLYTRPGFFDVLGVHPRLGRLWSAEDAAHGDVAVVTDALWRRRFNNRARVDGATLAVRDNQYKVIGVLPPHADLRDGVPGEDIWIPDPAPDTTGAGEPVLRIPGGATDTPLVQRQLNDLTRRWSKQYLAPNQQPYWARLQSLRPDPLDLQDYHRAMIGAALCVLLIACANVAALMLARGMVRRRDYALRLALGAARTEIAREVVVEVAVLAVVGCVVGALIATWAVGLITRATPAEMNWQGFAQPQWSLRVFAASGLAVLVSIAIAGGFPAWQASRTDPMGPLKESGGGTTGRAGTRFRWLVMGELALAMMLVMGASLMIKSAVRMDAYDFGYAARNLTAVDVYFPRRYISNGRLEFYKDTLADTAKARFNTEILARIAATPGVRGVAKFTGCNLRTGVVTTDRTVEGAAAGYVPTNCHVTSSGLFATMGVPIVDGRDFILGDDQKGAIILNERTAHLLFPHERAVGRTLKLGDLASDKPWLPIVGVVRNYDPAFNWFPEAGPDTSQQMYAMLATSRGDLGRLIVRVAGDPRDVDLALWKELRPTLPPHSEVHISPWVQSYKDGVRSEQFLSILFALLGFVSLLLGAAGLFSVISYIAGQRNREFAVRIALGATKQNVLNLVMKEALVMALGGTAVGAGLGMWAGFLLWNKMWGVYPVDAQALIGGETTLLLVTMLACLLPALRATKANPVDVLRAA